MSDLNDWVLTAGDDVLSFGTLATGFPFETQVTIGATTRETQDSPHPTSDGLLMGRDRLRGFTLQFKAKILQEYPLTAKPWMSALDLYGEFAAKWRSDAVRLSPGVYATMENTERGRLVYGRPRDIAPATDLLRKGVLTFQMDFDTNGPDFYGSTEKQAVMTVAGPAAGGTLSSPLTAPLSTVTPQAVVSPTVNDGNLPAWPVINFHGPGSKSSIELLDGTHSLWKISVPDGLKYDDVLTVDTRPWNRSATINGRPANGVIKGSQLEKCKIPVGAFDLRYRVADTTGQAFAAVLWRDTFASL